MAGNESFHLSIDSSVSAYYDSLKQSERNLVKTRSEGELNTLSGITIIKKQRGKTLFHLGFYRMNKLHLYPEETYCLAHRGVLDIYTSNNPNNPLTLREINDHLHGHIPRPCRQVYCYLKSHQFIPRRHHNEYGIHIPRISTQGNVYYAYDVHGPGKKIENPLFYAIICRMNDPQLKMNDFINTFNEERKIPCKLFLCDEEGNILSIEIKMGMIGIN